MQIKHINFIFKYEINVDMLDVAQIHFKIQFDQKK